MEEEDFADPGYRFTMIHQNPPLIPGGHKFIKFEMDEDSASDGAEPQQQPASPVPPKVPKLALPIQSLPPSKRKKSKESIGPTKPKSIASTSNSEDEFRLKLIRAYKLTSDKSIQGKEIQKIIQNNKKVNKSLKDLMLRQMKVNAVKAPSVMNHGQAKAALRKLGIVPTYTSEYKATQALKLLHADYLDLAAFL